jgi:protein required for attachment to host cells
MTTTWVVVADASRARIFSTEKAASPLVELQTLTHPEARLHEGDLVSDRPGRDRNSGIGSHDMGHESDAKEGEAIRFAAQICDALEEGRNAGRYEQLYLIAAPSFLGVLRKQQNGPLKKLVTEEVAKNLTTQSPADIRKALPDYL